MDLDRSKLKTYREWQVEGRTVARGQCATAYLVNDEQTESIALFTEEQTEVPSRDENIGDWTLIVTPEERPTTGRDRKKSNGKPKIKLDYNSETGIVSVWVGPNTRAIKQLSGNGFVYNPRSHRWTARRDEPKKVIAGLEKHNPKAEITVPPELEEPMPLV